MNKPYSILIVEDEYKLAQLLAEYLQRDGFITQHIERGDTVLAWITQHTPDLILLDLMLPGQDGLSICKELRKHSQIPIIITTARIEEIDRLLGLELGADDYVCKPYSPREVVARVKAVLRRLEANNTGMLNRPVFVIDRESLQIHLNNQVLDLTPVEFRLLASLLEPPGRVLSRNQLMDRLYADHRIVTDRTVDSHIKNLRRKLADCLPGQEIIHSIYGIGYKLEGNPINR